MGPSWWMCSSSTAAAVWDTMVDPARLARSYTWATEKGLCERIVRFPNCQVKQYARPYTTDDERAACKASLVGCDEDPEGLRKIKKLAAQQINESVPSPTSVRSSTSVPGVWKKPLDSPVLPRRRLHSGIPEVADAGLSSSLVLLLHDPQGHLRCAKRGWHPAQAMVGGGLAAASIQGRGATSASTSPQQTCT